MNSCSNGARISDALDVVKSSGVPTMIDFPYDQNDCERTPSDDVKSKALNNAASEWRRVEYTSIEGLQNFLIYGVPVIIGAEIHSNFTNLKKDVYRSIGGPKLGNHAMVIIGFDTSKEAFKVINSWGDDWGDNGYGWIDYNILKTITKESYVLFDKSKSNERWNLYQQCLYEGSPRCCDNLTAEFSISSKMCGQQPGLSRTNMYKWCTSLNRERCCDHITEEEQRSLKVCGRS